MPLIKLLERSKQFRKTLNFFHHIHPLILDLSWCKKKSIPHPLATASLVVGEKKNRKLSKQRTNNKWFSSANRRRYSSKSSARNWRRKKETEAAWVVFCGRADGNPPVRNAIGTVAFHETSRDVFRGWLAVALVSTASRARVWRLVAASAAGTTSLERPQAVYTGLFAYRIISTVLRHTRLIPSELAVDLCLDTHQRCPTPTVSDGLATAMCLPGGFLFLPSPPSFASSLHSPCLSSSLPRFMLFYLSLPEYMTSRISSNTSLIDISWR